MKKHDPKLNQDLNWLKEDISEDFRNRVLMSVKPELDKNKAQHRSFAIDLRWVWSSVLAFAFVGVIAIRISGLIDSDTPNTTFDDIALLTPEEFEVVENLDLIEEMKDIDLDQIRDEMKSKEMNKKENRS